MNFAYLNHASVEKTINYIALNNYSEHLVFEQVSTDHRLSLEAKDALTKKLKIAYKRMNEPLELSLRLFYFLVPFGIINAFISSEDSNFKRFKEFNYLRKINDYYKISVMGTGFYLLLGMTAGLIKNYI